CARTSPASSCARPSRMTCSPSSRRGRSASSGLDSSATWGTAGSSGPGCSRCGSDRDVSSDKLSGIQRRVLELLSSPAPRWTLTGGAALAGFYTLDRETRDLDLFFRDCTELGDHPSEITARLK